MQPGRRRGDRARLAREHGLVGLPVGRVAARRAPDVGRQRHGPVRLQRGVERGPFRREGQQRLARLAALLQHRFQPALKGDAVPFAQAPSGPREGEPAPGVHAPVQQRLHPGRAAPAPKPRRDHPRVVDDHEVAGPQQVRQVGDAPVREAVAHMQQPRRVARLRGALRDQVRGQVEIEIAGAQGHGRRAPMRAGTVAGRARPVKPAGI